MKTLVDMMNVLFICFYVANGQLRKQGITEFTEKSIPFFLHLLMNKMNSLFMDFKVLDICWDGRNSLDWRRSIYPGYKRNRDAKKGELSYKLLISTIPKVREVLNFYPCRQIEVNGVEADDIIFALAEKYAQKEHILIISSDGDLGQIVNFFGEKVKQFHPIKKIYLEPSKHLLEEKAIVGDVSDNISGLYRIGPKTFFKMIADKSFWNKKLAEGNNKAIYNSLLEIIDLRKFPYKNNILEEEKNLPYNKFNPDQVELFFWNNRLKDLLDRWPKLKENIQ